MTQGITSRHVRTAIVIVIIAAAAWIVRGVLLTFLIEPIGWLLWAAWRLVASVDRSLIWLGLIIVCSLLIIRVVPPDALGGEDVRDETRHSWNSGDRLAHWRTWAARSMTDVSGSSAFRLSLETMAAAVAEATRVPLPPSDVQEHEWRRQAGIARLGARIPRILPDHGRREDARRVEELMNWMESALEMKNEPSD